MKPDSQRFWVIDTAVGYEGGDLEHPTYKEVCTDRTGHAEVVDVTFDPSRVSLMRFWMRSWPSRSELGEPSGSGLGRAVPQRDLSTRTEQMRLAKEKVAELNASGAYRKPIATKVELGTTFWKAEEYHQRYLEKRDGALPHLGSRFEVLEKRSGGRVANGRRCCVWWGWKVTVARQSMCG